jgi:hypothetical protein
MTAERLAFLRVLLLGLTGLCCVGYAALALAQGRPDPVGWYIPGAVGAASAVLIALAALLAGRKQAGMASDDLYRHIRARAERQAYWVSMGLFGVAAVSCANGLIAWNTGFAAYGCLMGGAFLLLFVWHDLRMR